jgi:probable HAF family extracellular repeat protein
MKASPSLITLAALCITIIVPASSADILYTVTEIPSLPDPHGRPTVVAPTGLNEKGQVVGFMSTVNPPFFDGNGFITGPNGIGVRLLAGLSPNDRIVPGGVNDFGQVTGLFRHGGVDRAFLTEPNGGPLHRIGPSFGIFAGWDPAAVNNRAQITGTVLINIQEFHALFASADGKVVKDLGTLGGTLSYGIDINENGQVAGLSARNGITFFHAFLSEPNGGRLHDLGTLGGHFSEASGVNELGQVAGISSLKRDNTEHAFLSGPDGGPLLDLGTLRGSVSGASDVNDLGSVVGFSDLVLGGEHAFIYSPTFGMQDLNDLIDPDLGLELTGAGFINNRGQIVAGGIEDGLQQTFLLTPIAGVPDSGSTGTLFVCALLGILVTLAFQKAMLSRKASRRRPSTALLP